MGPEVLTTLKVSEYFDRTPKWVYWGLAPNPKTGVPVFVWPDGTPIEPARDRNGTRAFTTQMLRAIARSCYVRGSVDLSELTRIHKRIRLTELGHEWREREGWRLVTGPRGRTRWCHPDTVHKVNGRWVKREGL